MGLRIDGGRMRAFWVVREVGKWEMNEVERGQRRRGKEETTKKTGMGGCTGDGTDGYG